MSGFYVQTFGGFAVRCDGESVDLPCDVQRLVAFLSIHRGQMPRPFVAGHLWEEGSEKRVLGNLRSVLWRLRKDFADLIRADARTVSLSGSTTTDLSEVLDRSERLLGEPVLDLRGPGPAAVDLDHRPFTAEFLPGWYDEWVIVERERLRQTCLHALESIANRLVEVGRYGAAIQVLMCSIMRDELRESPRRQLMEVHLAEGNPTEAVRQYRDYAAVLDAALGMKPSPAMRDLLNTILNPVAVS